MTARDVHPDVHAAAANTRPGRPTVRRWVVSAAVAAMVAGTLAACGGGSGDNDAASPSASGQPKSGGTLTFAEFSAPVGLDPIVMTGSGTTGLTESYAVYDSLLRYDVASGTYEPDTADAVTPNVDHAE